MYSRIILPFQMDMQLFNSPLVNRSKANYDEVTRQIFQVMIFDLKTYHNCLSVLPNVSLLTDKRQLLESSNQHDLIIEALKFREVYTHYAINIYFACFEYKLFDSGVFNHLLEHINEDSFVLYCCKPLNF